MNTLSKICLGGLMLLISLTGCNQKALEEQNARLQTENDSLRILTEQTERITNAIFELSDSIAVMQDSAIAIAQDGALDDELALEQIRSIQDFIQERNAELQEFEREVTASGKKNRQLLGLVSKYRRQLEDKEREVAVLQSRIENLEFENQNLTAEVRTTKTRLTVSEESLAKRESELSEVQAEIAENEAEIKDAEMRAKSVRAELLKQQAETLELEADDLKTFLSKKKKLKKKELYQKAIEKYEEMLRLGDFTLVHQPDTKIKRLEAKIKKLGV
ncbi:MAG: hypothetical protein AAF740_11580 [Bacteroidota bacterium]